MPLKFGLSLILRLERKLDLARDNEAFNAKENFHDPNAL